MTDENKGENIYLKPVRYSSFGFLLMKMINHQLFFPSLARANHINMTCIPPPNKCMLKHRQPKIAKRACTCPIPL
jgi:hypothetical protein